MPRHGVLLHITSLPSDRGIGSVGKCAHDFLDFLSRSGQSIWQILPLCPVNSSGSPYSSMSAFASNPLLIDCSELVYAGLINESEIEDNSFLPLSYAKLQASRRKLLELCFARAGHDYRQREMREFACKNSYWLSSYAGYMAKTSKASEEFFVFEQFLFDEQWQRLRKKAKSLSISIMGDLPMYVTQNSSDFAMQPDAFLTNQKEEPAFVAGVPPDYFSKTGQLWGNPLYDIEAMRKNGFEWWKNRIHRANSLYDMLRIDHFRGFESFYALPAGSKTAENGVWLTGGGTELVDAINSVSKLEIVAEDLGCINAEVNALRRYSGFLSTRVVQFAFDSENSLHLPSNYDESCVCYSGTHDNPPLCTWLRSLNRETRSRVDAYVKNAGGTKSTAIKLLSKLAASNAAISIIPMQDYLLLGSASRMNIPGRPRGNWRYRLSNMPDEQTAAFIRSICSFTV